MFTHTTAKGLQAEKIRQASRPVGRKSDQELTQVTINWKRIGTSIAAGVAALASLAASAGGENPAEAPTTQQSTSQLGSGPNLGPLVAD